MTNFVLPALASAVLFGLSACGEPAEPVGEDETMSEPAMTDPAMTEPVVPAPGQAEQGRSMMVDRTGRHDAMPNEGTTTTENTDANPSMAVDSN